MFAIRLDTPIRRHLGKTIIESGAGAEADAESGVISYAKDSKSSIYFLVLDAEGARHAADALMEDGPPEHERGELWAELVAFCDGEPSS